MDDEYDYIIVESFKPLFSEGSSFRFRVRPVFDQGDFKTSMRVECPSEMRDPTKYPIGTQFRIRAKIVDSNGSKFIYTHYKWKIEVLTLGR